MKEETLLKLIDLNQIAIQELGSQIELLKQKITRVEDRNNELVNNILKYHKEIEKWLGVVY